MTRLAYVDGSYIDGRVGYGAVLLDENETIIEEFSGGVNKNTDARQVAGELVAVMTVLDYCQQHDIDTVDIYYDYNGIEKWARGQWKTNTPLTKRYAAYMSKQPVTINWHKVESHSGDKWNDYADELAKSGAGEATQVDIEEPVDQSLLAAIAEHFVTTLHDAGIEAEFDKVLNNQYARVLIFKGDKRVGFFDLYNTKNRPLVPYLHAFKDAALQALIDERWKRYKKTLSEDENLSLD